MLVSSHAPSKATDSCSKNVLECVCLKYHRIVIFYDIQPYISMWYYNMDTNIVFGRMPNLKHFKNWDAWIKLGSIHTKEGYL